jgi:hypothetical protein
LPWIMDLWVSKLTSLHCSLGRPVGGVHWPGTKWWEMTVTAWARTFLKECIATSVFHSWYLTDVGRTSVTFPSGCTHTRVFSTYSISFQMEVKAVEMFAGLLLP